MVEGADEEKIGNQSITMSLLRLFVYRTAAAGNRLPLFNRYAKFSSTSTVLNDKETKQSTFDESLLEFLVCPLSKNSLRYDKEKGELICDEINVAYPIVNGIPNLVPQDARMLKNGNSVSTNQHLKTENRV